MCGFLISILTTNTHYLEPVLVCRKTYAFYLAHFTWTDWKLCSCLKCEMRFCSKFMPFSLEWEQQEGK